MLQIFLFHRFNSAEKRTPPYEKGFPQPTYGLKEPRNHHSYNRDEEQTYKARPKQKVTHSHYLSPPKHFYHLHDSKHRSLPPQRSTPNTRYDYQHHDDVSSQIYQNQVKRWKRHLYVGMRRLNQKLTI